MKKTKILLVLPAYNEEKSLPSLLKRIDFVFQEFELNAEVLLVNDGSKDSTLQIAQDYQGSYKIHIADVQPNQGLANAIRVGFTRAVELVGENDFIFLMDADDSHPPALIPRMINRLHEGADVVIASRYREGSRIKGLSGFRKFLSSGAGILFRVFIRLQGVRDYTCGFRGYKAAVLRQTLAFYGDRYIEEKGFSAMAEVIIKMKRFNPIFIEVPFILRYDQKASDSKMKVFKTVKQTMNLIVKSYSF